MKTTFYIQFEGVTSYDKRRIVKVHARRITLKRPERTIPRGIVVKMTMDIPEDAFMPFEPAVDIIIPIDRTLPIAAFVEKPDYPDYPCPDDPDGVHHIGCGCEFNDDGGTA